VLLPRAHTITTLTRRVLDEVLVQQLQQQRKWKNGQWRSYATSSRSGKQDVSSLCITSATFSTDGTHRASQLPEIWLMGQLKYCCRYTAARQTAYPKIYRAREGWLHIVGLSLSLTFYYLHNLQVTPSKTSDRMCNI